MKKTISLSLVLSILALSGNLFAHKQGAVLRITDGDGQVIEGELLAIKQDSLLLMAASSQEGFTVDIDDIKSIEIKRDSRESRFWSGFLPRALILGAVGFGFAFGKAWIGGEEDFQLEDGYPYAYIFALSGATLWGLAKAVPGEYKTIRIEEKSPLKRENILKKLEKKARFGSDVPKTIEPILVPTKISRFHFTVDHGYFSSNAFDFDRVFGPIGLGGDETLIGPIGQMKSDQIPYFKNFKLEYSISKKLALGFVLSPIRKIESSAAIIAKVKVDDPPVWQNEYTYVGCELEGKHRGGIYSLTAAYMPLPATFYKKSSFKAGIGLGLSVINLNFRTTTGGYPGTEFDNIRISKVSPCLIAFGEYNFYYNRKVSIGINAEYRYVPVKIEDFQLVASYGYGMNGEYKQLHSSTLGFSERSVNFGGFGIGISLGFHF
jgi:hypothetical protein